MYNWKANRGKDTKQCLILKEARREGKINSELNKQ